MNVSNGKIIKRGDSYCIDLRIDGRRIRKSVGKKKSEALAAIEALKTDARRGEYRFTNESKIRFKDFAQEYLEMKKTNKPRSWTRLETSLKNLTPKFGDMLLVKITPKHIEEYRQKRLKDVKPATVNRELACLKNMYTIAIKFKYVNENPVKQVEFCQEPKFDMRVLNSEEAQRLIKTSSEHLKPIVIIALNTGMRKGELLKLKWDDLDLDFHFIHIKDAKGGKTREIPMNQAVVEAFESIERESEFVFYNQSTKDRLKDVQTGFNGACLRAGIKKFRFHDLRHTAATQMVMGGVDLVTVSKILGHSDITTTMRYAHPTPESRRKAVDVLADYFNKRKEKMDTKWTQPPVKVNVSHSYISN